MEVNLGKNESPCDDFSPPLEAGLQRGDSNRSWSLSQGKDQEHEKDQTKMSKDKLFLVSLGTLISLFK
jgi:hypothetical protein